MGNCTTPHYPLPSLLVDMDTFTVWHEYITQNLALGKGSYGSQNESVTNIYDKSGRPEANHGVFPAYLRYASHIKDESKRIELLSVVAPKLPRVCHDFTRDTSQHMLQWYEHDAKTKSATSFPVVENPHSSLPYFCPCNTERELDDSLILKIPH